MKNITWLVQTNNIDYRHVTKIWDAAKKYASVEEAVVIPFKDTLYNEVDPIGKYIIPYGSVRLGKIAMSQGWQGVYQNDKVFDSTIWIQQRDDMLNSPSVSMSIDDLARIEVPDKIFIRPTSDHKSFTGFVASHKGITDLIERARIPDNASFNLDSKVSISKVKSIQAEYRYFIVGGVVVTGSLYALHGVPISQPVTDEHRLQEAQKRASSWLPHETCVMDLADTDEGIKVVEFNSFNSAGFYDHDVDAIVKAVVDWENAR